MCICAGETSRDSQATILAIGGAKRGTNDGAAADRAGRGKLSQHERLTIFGDDRRFASQDGECRFARRNGALAHQHLGRGLVRAEMDADRLSMLQSPRRIGQDSQLHQVPRRWLECIWRG